MWAIQVYTWLLFSHWNHNAMETALVGGTLCWKVLASSLSLLLWNYQTVFQNNVSYSQSIFYADSRGKYMFISVCRVEVILPHCLLCMHESTFYSVPLQSSLDYLRMSRDSMQPSKGWSYYYLQLAGSSVAVRVVFSTSITAYNQPAFLSVFIEHHTTYKLGRWQAGPAHTNAIHVRWYYTSLGIANLANGIYQKPRSFCISMCCTQ